jgi:hypothetical protein
MKAILMSVVFLTSTFNSIVAQTLPVNSCSLPVLITLDNGNTGSGFFIDTSNHFFLATAAHVLFDRNTGRLLGDKATISWHTTTTNYDFYNTIRLNLSGLQTNNEIRLHSTHDVAVVRLGTFTPDHLEIFNNTMITNVSTNFYRTPVPEQNAVWKLKEVNVGDDVYVFGFPGSVGIQQSPKFDYTKPLLRKGIVAGIYDKAQTIVIDAAVYFGSSGGPVLERQQIAGVIVFKVIGVASEIIPFVDIWENKRFQYSNINVSNSGYAVVEPIDFIIELLWDN